MRMLFCQVPFGNLRISSSMALCEPSMIMAATVSRSPSPNSSSISSSDSDPDRLQAVSEYRSPSAATGSRTLARRISNSVSLSSPSRNRWPMGKLMPSSNTWVPSGPNPRPPTSAICEVAAKRATGRSLRNTGVTTVKSFRCPVPCHGSLVASTSPGLSTRSGYFSRKKPMLAAIALT